MSAQLALLPGYLTAHLQLTLIALALAILISVPAGILATRWPWIERPALSVAGVIQTIPALALLAIAVPVLAMIGWPSIGVLPAIIGLTLYGILPILRNTVTGIAGVDPAVKEAARGVGMTSLQQLQRVELPLAMPVIVAGIRTATVWTVGMATLSTPVGATSLGNYIFSGLQTRNTAAVLVGCVSAAGLALLLDGLIHTIETAVRERRKRRLVPAVAVLGGLMLFAGASLARTTIGSGSSDRPFVIGAKTFTEQYILGAILAQQVEDETGRSAQVLSSLGSTVAFDALRDGRIDAYVDYSGTIWTTILHQTGVPDDRASLKRQVASTLAARYGVTVACALGFENAYALAMPAKEADRLGVTRISQLTPHAPSLSIGSDYEFFSRPEWRAIEAAYQLHFSRQRSMDPSLMYEAVANGSVDVISAYSTDGRIAAYDLRVLTDDRGAIPPYDALVLVNSRTAREYPTFFSALEALGGRISGDVIREMNRAVDQDKRQPEAVAAAFLRDRRP